ncbi:MULTISPECIES: hypothetical protein [unclassified Streptomyces]|uniref:hypothetical protein n=1 Tax=Streptomyces sp. LamerLS-31b TaxID=1839765 RepID=UPI001EFD735D|nr:MULTISPECIES: hypothetical protein [unclassified Streptomyces]
MVESQRQHGPAARQAQREHAEHRCLVGAQRYRRRLLDHGGGPGAGGRRFQIAEVVPADGRFGGPEVLLRRLAVHLDDAQPQGVMARHQRPYDTGQLFLARRLGEGHRVEEVVLRALREPPGEIPDAGLRGKQRNPGALRHLGNIGPGLFRFSAAESFEKLRFPGTELTHLFTPHRNGSTSGRRERSYPIPLVFD